MTLYIMFSTGEEKKFKNYLKELQKPTKILSETEIHYARGGGDNIMEGTDQQKYSRGRERKAR